MVSLPLRRRFGKKLIKDTCSKTAFMLDGIMYEQTDGVNMGASLGPVLANIIMTEMERCYGNHALKSLEHPSNILRVSVFHMKHIKHVKMRFITNIPYKPL